jgi:glycosyltransferase involved in cell wall biosynthesis
MKISIVTVSYNAAATIADTIASVQTQDHPDVEHIIIDGASRDGTQALVERLADARTTFVSEPDRGLYDAMNKGIARATGDVIGILNADDFFADAGCLSAVADAFTRRSDVDAVLGDIAFVDAHGRQMRRYDSGRFRPAKARWGWMPAHPGMYLTRAGYDRIGGYRTDFRIAADFDFVVRAFAVERLRYVHLPRVLVHMRPGGASTDGLRAKLTINREVVRACRDNGIYTNLPMVMSKYPLKLLELLR